MCISCIYLELRGNFSLHPFFATWRRKQYYSFIGILNDSLELSLDG